MIRFFSLLLISFLGLSASAFACFDPALSATTRVQLASGSVDLTLPTSLGSEIDAGACDTLAADLGASGFFDAAPSARFSVGTDGNQPLFISSRAACDTVMVLQGPDGAFLFSDDDGSGNQPLLQVPAVVGDYHVWIGRYDASQQCEAQVTVKTLDNTCPDVSADGTLSLSDLSQNLAVQAGGSRDLKACNLEIGTEAEDQRGFFTASPTLALAASDLPELETLLTQASDDVPAGFLNLSIKNTCDTQLAALGSDGTWYYSDDYDQEVDLSPALQIPLTHLDGLKVWAGTYAPEACDVELTTQLAGTADTCPSTGRAAMQSGTLDASAGDLEAEVTLTTAGSLDLQPCLPRLDDVLARGYSDLAPAYVLSVEEGLSFALNVKFTSTCEGVLLARDHAGAFSAHVASDEGFSLAAENAGDYAFWLVNGQPDACEATLNLTGRQLSCPNPGLPGKETHAYDLPALISGQTHDVVAGGKSQLRDCGFTEEAMQNSGIVIDRPDFVFDLDVDGKTPVIFETDGQCDTILVLNDTQGNWYYDDDSASNEKGAQVVIKNAPAGLYQAWVGTFEDSLCEGSMTVRRGLVKD